MKYCGIGRKGEYCEASPVLMDHFNQIACALDGCNVFSNVCINFAYPLTLSPNPSQVTIGICSLFELYALNFLPLHTLDLGFDYFLLLSMPLCCLEFNTMLWPPARTSASDPAGEHTVLPWPHCCMILARIEKGPAKEIFWSGTTHFETTLLNLVTAMSNVMSCGLYLDHHAYYMILVKTINAIPE